MYHLPTPPELKAPKRSGVSDGFASGPELTFEQLHPQTSGSCGSKPYIWMPFLGWLPSLCRPFTLVLTWCWPTPNSSWVQGGVWRVSTPCQNDGFIFKLTGLPRYLEHLPTTKNGEVWACCQWNWSHVCSSALGDSSCSSWSGSPAETFAWSEIASWHQNDVGYCKGENFLWVWQLFGCFAIGNSL